MFKEAFKGCDVLVKEKVMQILKMIDTKEKGKSLCKSVELDFLRLVFIICYIKLK